MAHIDEKLAEQAWYGIHMGEYKGYATAEYDEMCAKARDAADAAIARAPHRAEEVEGIYARYCEKAAEYINEGNRIDAMCPSAFIVGPANFPTKKKQRQIDAMDAHYKRWDGYFDRLIGKLNLIGTDAEPIMGGDADALDRLREKLEGRQRTQDLMRRANAYWRKHGTLHGMEGLTAEAAEKIERDMREPYHMHDMPFAPYQLSNNNAEIRRIKARIEALGREKAMAAERAAAPQEVRTVSICGEVATVFEDAEDMRLRLMFDGKPSEECREALKRSGFRWSPRNQAWQRQLTDNARHALRRIADAA